jgi:hypothetical protein
MAALRESAKLGSAHLGSGQRSRRSETHQHAYKWIVLSNTTLGVLMAVINGSIVTIALPAIFRGINLNPLQSGNISYLLWIMMGYLLVTAVLVVGLGRLGDMFGRVHVSAIEPIRSPPSPAHSSA